MDIKLFFTKMNDYGLDISSFNSSFVERRALVRMRATNHSDLETYYSDFDQDEAIKLKEELFINVTNLFRDTTPFEQIQKLVIPQLPSSPKIWSAGCSNGSEATSLAILFLEKGITPKILCTDIDKDILAKARKFTFDEQLMKEVPESYYKHFTKNDDGTYVSSSEVQSCITFEQQDILQREIPQTDLVVCRNTVIYFTPEVKQAFYDRIYTMLPQGGFFVLGKTETLLGPARMKFTIVDAVNKIYQKK